MGRHRPKYTSTLKDVILRITATTLVIGGGATLATYPVAATAYNNYRASEVAREYSTMNKDIPQNVLDEQLHNARMYNENLTTVTISDPWLSEDTSETNMEKYREYLTLLGGDLNEPNEFQPMSRLTIPDIGVDLPIFRGSSDAVLAQGVGHLFGTDLPIGATADNPTNHSVLTAHTAMSSATMFDRLIEIDAADNTELYVMVKGEVLKYQVRETEIVLPDDVAAATKVRGGQDTITLITCTPYGVNTHRLLVTAYRVPLDGDKVEGSVTAFTALVWWMKIVLAAVALIYIALIIWIVRELGRYVSRQQQ